MCTARVELDKANIPSFFNLCRLSHCAWSCFRPLPGGTCERTEQREMNVAGTMQQAASNQIPLTRFPPRPHSLYAMLMINAVHDILESLGKPGGQGRSSPLPDPHQKGSRSRSPCPLADRPVRGFFGGGGGGGHEQRIQSSHIPPGHRHMVITIILSSLYCLAALQRKPDQLRMLP